MKRYQIQNSIIGKKTAIEKSLNYMGLKAGDSLKDISIQSIHRLCTNGRIEDLRAAANYIQGKKVSHNVQALVVRVGFSKKQAESEGIKEIFLEAGFEGEIRAVQCVLV